MIIKKKKNNTNNTNNESIKQTDIPELPKSSQGFLDIQAEVVERQERRRGDRRRGYRRIEDRSLVSRAHEEAKIIKEQAQAEGFNNGLTRADMKIAELQDVITSLIGVKEEAYEYYKKDIAVIAVEVAKKILNKHVQFNEDTIIEIASNVIKEISEEESRITFLINPDDELVLAQNLETNMAFKNKKAKMLIQTDEAIERGSCKVLTTSGQIDATFTSQLAIIKKAFEEGI